MIILTLSNEQWHLSSFIRSRHLSPGEGNGNPLQYSYLENSRDRGAWPTTAWGHKDWKMTKRLTLSLSFRHLNTVLVSGMPATSRCNTALLPQRNRTRAAPVLGISLQWPAGPSQRPVQHSWPMHTFLVLQQKGPVLFP